MNDQTEDERMAFLKTLGEEAGEYIADLIREHPERKIHMTLFLAERDDDGAVMAVYGNANPFRMIATFLARQAEVDEADKENEQ